ncbi:hypothetical protein [Streptomyces sp. UNOB3_S3]|uniref:hypothetical protein n=1 Tax=Streptomyces sp. UNOB3_S3 TaxID=2871682 RepID=UPI001E4728A2|nr:hypothetical protein [Streptomyces sp. UNOB3_S3]MCC3773882.1 hypothetical protein [Streptomyces sp. UNOB3_S3]
METAGWAAALVSLIAGLVWVLGSVFDQIPTLCAKAVKAIRALREVRAELRGENDGTVGAPPPAIGPDQDL